MSRTFADMAAQLDVPWCGGDCGIDASHDRGFLFLDVVHFRERRFTRRGAKRFLMLVAERNRLLDSGYLNDRKRLGAFYVYHDAVVAQGLAGQLGFRIPARAFEMERLRMRSLRQPVTLPPRARSWMAR